MAVEGDPTISKFNRICRIKTAIKSHSGEKLRLSNYSLRWYPMYLLLGIRSPTDREKFTIIERPDYINCSAVLHEEKVSFGADRPIDMTDQEILLFKDYSSAPLWVEETVQERNCLRIASRKGAAILLS